MTDMSRVYNELEAALEHLDKAVFSQPTDELSEKKLTIRPVMLRERLCFQTESVKNNMAYHRNLSAEELLRHVQSSLDGRYRQVLIVTEAESSQYVLKRNGEYKKTASAPTLPKPGGGKSHNREKEYVLAEGENIPALVDLGVFTADFKVVRSCYDKYKQINRFVELVDHEFSKSDEREISILDFGCGKSYLTFILYYYFTVKKGMRANIIGYDLKAEVVDDCNKIAQKYGYVGLKFQTADVTKDNLADEHIDMVVTLHACDTATDYALYYAISRGVRHIFSVPCCQHEINGSIEKGGELDLFMRHGLIKERMCALLTDSVRAAVLEGMGYQVDMIEFIDFEHSPKNIMIRAHKDSGRRPEHIRAARELQERYGFKQTLLELCESNG